MLAAMDLTNGSRRGLSRRVHGHTDEPPVKD
jgi:hypothetical protein